MIEKIIYRLDRRNMNDCKYYLYYEKSKPYNKQEEELFKFRGIDFIEPEYLGSDNLHVYKTYIEKSLEIKELNFSINIPFNIATTHNFYIDYLYYINILDKLNHMILIKRKYLIDVWRMDIPYLTSEMSSSTWNDNTHTSIYLDFEFNY